MDVLDSQDETLLYQTSLKQPTKYNSINKIYVSDSKSVNPLVENKGSSQYSKTKKFSFENTKFENAPCVNPHLTGLEDMIYVPPEEFKETEKSISSYSFGFTGKLFKQTLTEIKNKHNKLNGISFSVGTQMAFKSIQNKEKNFGLTNCLDVKDKYQSLCLKFTMNYIQNSLQIKEIYDQYVNVAKSNNEVTRTLSFKNQTLKNELNKESFKKDITIYGSKVKKIKKHLFLI